MPTKFEKLDALYATLPTVECLKKCAANCGPIRTSRIEVQRVEEKKGFVASRNLGDSVFWQPTPRTLDCQFLMPTLGTCSIYLIRPAICRLFGVVDNPKLRCSFGCQPVPRYLTNEEAKKVFEEVLRIQEEP
jgi:Fe-S-cluster containining protein